jgi:hypothetical protein
MIRWIRASRRSIYATLQDHSFLLDEPGWRLSCGPHNIVSCQFPEKATFNLSEQDSVSRIRYNMIADLKAQFTITIA